MKLFIGIPCYGSQVTLQCTLSLMTLASHLTARGIESTVYTVANSSVVQVARNEIVAAFLASDATHLFFVDVDTEFRAVDVLAMIDADKPWICGAPPMKQYDWRRITEAALRGEADVEAAGFSYTVRFDGELDEGMLATGVLPLRCGNVAFAVLQRRVIEKVIEHEGEAILYRNQHGEPRWAVFDCAIRGGLYYQESDEFSVRVRAAGETIWLYAPAQLSHVGMHTWRGRLRDLAAGE